MAAFALRKGMAAFESESGIFNVVKSNALPLSYGMADLALKIQILMRHVLGHNGAGENDKR